MTTPARQSCPPAHQLPRRPPARPALGWASATCLWLLRPPCPVWRPGAAGPCATCRTPPPPQPPACGRARCPAPAACGAQQRHPSTRGRATVVTEHPRAAGDAIMQAACRRAPDEHVELPAGGLHVLGLEAGELLLRHRLGAAHGLERLLAARLGGRRLGALLLQQAAHAGVPRLQAHNQQAGCTALRRANEASPGGRRRPTAHLHLGAPRLHLLPGPPELRQRRALRLQLLGGVGLGQLTQRVSHHSLRGGARPPGGAQRCAAPCRAQRRPLCATPSWACGRIVSVAAARVGPGAEAALKQPLSPRKRARRGRDAREGGQLRLQADLAGRQRLPLELSNVQPLLRGVTPHIPHARARTQHTSLRGRLHVRKAPSLQQLPPEPDLQQLDALRVELNGGGGGLLHAGEGAPVLAQALLLPQHPVPH